MTELAVEPELKRSHDDASILGADCELPAASGIARELPASAGDCDLPASAGGRELPASSGIGRELPASSGIGRELPPTIGAGRTLPLAAGGGRTLPPTTGIGRELPDREMPVPLIGSLSPSRAADFKNCPLLYRFRTIDRLPEAPSRAAVRGTMVHSVLERLFDLPRAERTIAAAREMVPQAWQGLMVDVPEVAELFADDTDGAELAEWLASAGELLGNYFELEDPSRFEPAAREQLVEVVIDGLRLRGYIDRLDVNGDGDLRVVDYKTGSTPREAFEAKALFQMKFYALVLWRTRGIVPRQLRLMYLADTDTLSYAADADELTRFERTLKAIWAAIELATQSGDFRPNPSRLCAWCTHQTICPAFGGTPPPFPSEAPPPGQPDRHPVQ